ncbi:maleylpyruvate isomerase N-terminal domain-containing protein [Streptomyces sp. ACA25]|uniref:maleylpyruvate isomerase N-terminal domain-containing protein n=1 Tax=Streptomyces sp. ACA25 TaxID=3022596 RepID=UPI002307584E|nr:maleylpyruvate isomerase N-terminal domain-containing protein [Streptomyces sp. ACA25]MDB1086228.1 maleylpyruvate isomerase N-terminal domain-containing protein [Streptomyces sp. ACA25]
MTPDHVLDAFRLEAGQLSRAMAGVSEAEWRLPTRCAPWTVGELLAHVRVVIARLPDMLTAPAPTRAEVSAVEYYRPDGRFAPESNTARIVLAQAHAAEQVSGSARVEDFTATWQRVDRLCRAEPEGRVVRTRHGDPMLLSDFLLTRVVELTLHGLDLADALGREPWLTSQAAGVVRDLLLDPEGRTALEELQWGQLRFLRKATGREPITREEALDVDRLGIRWLTLG